MMLQADNFVWLPEYGQNTFLPYLFTDSRVQEPVHIWLELGLRHSCFVDICVIFFKQKHIKASRDGLLGEVFRF